MLFIGGTEWFINGGWAMYPLALLSIYTLFALANRTLLPRTIFIRTLFTGNLSTQTFNLKLLILNKQLNINADF